MKKLIFIRKISQLFFLFIFIYILWSITYPLKGIISPQFIFKIDPLIMIFTSVSMRILISGLIFSAIMLAATFIFGRFFCGWICPLGTVIDIMGKLRKNKAVLKDSQNKKARKIKFGLLAIISILSFFGIQAAWVFDPIVIIARVISLNLIPSFTLVVDKIFIFLIQNFELYGGVYDFYRNLKTSLLGVNVYYFANSLSSFTLFLIITISAFFVMRFWCRVLCPLGAVYAISSKISLLERVVDGCTSCGKCRKGCRMGAIKENYSYEKGECILCMDCVYDCPNKKTHFSFIRSVENKDPAEGVSRKDFLFLMLSSFFLVGYKGRNKENFKEFFVIRPPGVLNEEKFLNTCVRCGNCMKVCVTNGLQPVMLESGMRGIWSPRLVPEIGYCEYNCTLCGEVCPTGAIPLLPIAQKQKVKMGIARVVKKRCIAWAENKECLVCEEHCPIPDKAIKIDEAIIDGQIVQRPYVDKDLCIGCGICQNKCPINPVRAIIVGPVK